MAGNDNYSLIIGLVFVFNLVLGTGVLTMPSVFDSAGYIIGIVVIAVLCFVSFVQVTFVIEAMSNANFVKRVDPLLNYNRSDDCRETSQLLPSSSSTLSCENSSNEESEPGPESQSLNVVVDSMYRFQATKFRKLYLALESNRVSVNSLSSTISNDHYTTTHNGSINVKQPSTNAAYEKTEEDDDNYEPSWPSDHQNNGNLKVETSSQNDIVYNTQAQDYSNFEYGQKSTKNLVKLLSKLRDKFDITDKFELGNMGELFFNKYLAKLFFFSLIVYLFGDLLIYNSMMSKSLRSITCTSKSYCSDETNSLDYRCWDSMSISRRNVYRLYLLGFFLILAPLTYARLQKTQIIQILTIVLRWLAFISMTGITFKLFINKEATGKPPMANLVSFPKLFGICIYSFMCHHSLPSILTPIRNKARLQFGLSVTFILVLFCYAIIALTGIFAFEKVEDVYTLNFQINGCSSNSSNATNPASIPVFDIFLPTFPIFTLFSSYPFIALSLINNIKVLFDGLFKPQVVNSRWLFYSFPMIAIVPPLVVALFTEDVSLIVQYVGSYSGSLIQYVFPTLLVYYSRSIVQSKYIVPYVHRKISSKINVTKSDASMIYRTINPMASPFQGLFWIIATGVWWIISLALVTFNHIQELVQ